MDIQNLISNGSTSQLLLVSINDLKEICSHLYNEERIRQEKKKEPKKGNAKECSNYHTIALISHPSKVMLKILQARIQQYVNCELSDV